ncbi:MAG: 2-dehydro-3-deoxygalactonokinase [Spirochaetaceae bacterium]|nr:2-dehydro-3-deoxygalactonokinase [Spirochaetaceae bacterium]MCF7947375.1 2-dehydro-3-deoxygalactonokinase [Spirochaetia bacterium]MCF7950311.1 2-dehydro-3-deoxygalactonokinase [Spirochaetaceae bacterium]
MYIATIDCGTTNSRVYIVNEHGEVLGKASKKVGVKDTAATGNSETLKNGLKEAYYAAVAQAELESEDIQFIISSGMITSELGLKELPHLWAPAGMQDLADNITKVHDTSVFPIDKPVYFVRGIKNMYSPETTTKTEAQYLDFMRGEETQVAGILSSYSLSLPTTVIVLSSHMKCIPVTVEEKIAGSLTTVSGQVYEAILKETFIGKSIRAQDDFADKTYFDNELVNFAYEITQSAGFLRALLLPRFYDTLLSTKWYERKLFVEAVIAAEDSKALSQFSEMGFPTNSSYLFIGSEHRCNIYEYLFREKLGIETDIKKITTEDEIGSLSIKGALFLARKAGLLA